MPDDTDNVFVEKFPDDSFCGFGILPVIFDRQDNLLAIDAAGAVDLFNSEQGAIAPGYAKPGNPAGQPSDVTDQNRLFVAFAGTCRQERQHQSRD